MQEETPLVRHTLTDAEKLLQEFQLTEEDLNLAGIQIEDLDHTISPSFLGKCLHFLVSVNILRAVTLWPFMQRSSIKINKNTIAEDKQRLFLQHKKDQSSVNLNDGEWEFSTDTEEESVKGESSDLSLTGDINNEDNESQLMEEIIEVNKGICSVPVLTFSGLLFESENTLKGVSAVSAFHDTTDNLINGVWNAFLSSLIINGLVNYILYPEEREPTDLLDALGITGLRNIACIRSIESIKNSILCSENYKKGYNDILSSSLSSYYIWPFLAGIPLVFGVINAVHASWNMSALNKQEIKGLIQQLKEYQPGFWEDGLGWIITTAIPDLLPPFAILFILPQPAIKQALGKIKQTIIWDGRLSAKDRQLLFNHLNKFAQQRSQFTQMKALSMLADIVDNINYKNLSLLKEEGFDDETIKTLIIIKAKALKELSFLSNHYNLPDAPSSWYRPFFRYLYANYLMWNLGYPQQGFLQPLFFASKMIKLYFTLIFYKSIIGGVIEIINNYLDKKNCLEAGKEWTYFKALNEFNCTVCADLKNFYSDIFDVQGCVNGYMSKLRTFEDLMANITNRDQQINSQGVKRAFDLNEVTEFELTRKNIHFEPGQLATLLNALKPKMTKLHSFIMDQYDNDGYAWTLNQADVEAFGQFIQDPQILSFVLNDELIKEIGYALLQAKCEILELKIHETFNMSSISVLAEGLKRSNVSSLLLDILNHDKYVRTIVPILPYSKIVNLTIKNSFSSIMCQEFAKVLPLSPIKKLEMFNSYLHFYVDTPCALALIDGIKNRTEDFGLDISEARLNGEVIDLFANALPDMPHLRTFRYTNDQSDTTVQPALLKLLTALPHSKVEDFRMGYPPIMKYSIFIPALAEAIDKSNITRFPLKMDLNSVEDFNLLVSLLPTQFKKITELYLDNITDENITQSDIINLFEALPYTAIERLDLKFLLNGTLSILSQVLGNTSINNLNLWRGLDDPLGMAYLVNTLPSSQVNSLSFFRSYDKVYNETFKILFEGLAGTPVNEIHLLGAYTILNEDAEIIAAALTVNKKKHGLWIDKANTIIQNALLYGIDNPKTNLTILKFPPRNAISDSGATAICNVLPQTLLDPRQFSFDKKKVNQSIIDNCGVISGSDTSTANSICPMGPYILLYRLYQTAQQSFYSLLYNRYKVFVGDSIQSKPEYNDCNNTTTESIPSADSSQQTINIIDVSHYVGGETIIVDLNEHEAIAVIGSINSNNVLIGRDDSLLDVSQNRRANFLQAGKNNQLRLGFFSKDHVVVTENQGTVQVESFDSKDTLHLMSEHTVYNIETNVTICQNQILENNMPAAVIHIQETTVQLLNTHCEDIEDNIEINNDEAIYAAQREVMDSAVNHHSPLYTNLLSICETFLNSVNKSALFTAAPIFVGEILHRSGGYTRAEIEKFSEEIQRLLVLSFADSPHVMAASVLASWLATKLTNSPTIISTVGLGASIVASVASTALSANVSLSWMALQTGVALMGSVVGSYSVRWGLDKVSEVKAYLSSKVGFWSSQSGEEGMQLSSYVTSPTMAYR